MLSHSGKEAREVYKTLAWAVDGDKDKFDKVVEAFERFCSPQKNILYERHGFWSLHQQEGEAIDAYVTRLKLKSDQPLGSTVQSVINLIILLRCAETRNFLQIEGCQIPLRRMCLPLMVRILTPQTQTYRRRVRIYLLTY